METEITCIVCPKGCRILVKEEGRKGNHISGYGCQRGRSYAEGEALHPCRILTASIPMKGGNRLMLPIRSSSAIPKKKLQECMNEIRSASVSAPIEFHQIIIRDILNTGADMVACMPAETKREG